MSLALWTAALDAHAQAFRVIFPKEKQMMWYGLDLIVTSETHEAVEYALMEAGAVGTETNEIPDELVQVTGYFDHTPNRELVRGQLADALRIYNQSSSSVSEMSIREVPAEDWLGEWKKNWQPVKTGRFIVAPPWSDIPEASDQVVIRIEPGMAFGTGTHETTRLCLTASEKYFNGGSFLDVGTGTGILAIAAAKLFPNARVEAVDTDAQAIEIARENARLNEVAQTIVFSVGTVNDATASADLVCANLTADVISSILPQLIGATCGRLVLSGILDVQLEAMRARLHECGVLEPLEVVSDGEWIALIV
ncbi:MAG TPA: 50S ribosomal protein L11 methyltransferase [Pyrinomonadaceae bacterium]|nr:50S ribosomal protein L11 methyltransferase [Pyrinomonadaceae bacterium]